jgi:hypothetical protein
MSGVIQFLKGNAVLLALVAIVLIQQSELKEMERTLNYIYASVQSNNDDIQVVLDQVWTIGDQVADASEAIALESEG